uniref:Uncharacterized protein n=1 Tax=Arundo donax TaxID=35708 RepID=A0A0A8Y182_ARUDO
MNKHHYKILKFHRYRLTGILLNMMILILQAIPSAYYYYIQ